MNLKSEEKSCCFTGHRDILQSEYADISKKIAREMSRLYDGGIRSFIAGGAIGFDMIAAVTVLNMKHEFPDIELVLALPCRDHDKKWSQHDKAMLATLMRRADEIIYVAESYQSGCMLARNRFMVDNSSVCISYCHKTSGGSYYTENYAKKHGKTVVKI